MRIRSSLALGALAALPVLSGLACGGEGAPDLGLAAAPREVHHVRISADDLAALPVGQTLTVDLGAKSTAYHFVLSPTLDFARITLVSPDGVARSMADVLAAASAALDLTSATDKRLVLAGDPASFEELSSAEVQSLLDRGVLVTTPGGAAPGASPQTENPCDDFQAYNRVKADVGGAAFAMYSAQLISYCGDLCTPGSAEPCYAGPTGTEGVGTCHAGTKTCRADGLGYGACQGQVLPQNEVCATAADEDCNGVTTCSGAIRWSTSISGDHVVTNGLGIDAAGNTFVGGHFSYTSASLASTPLDTAYPFTGFLAKLDPNGALLWAKKFGGGFILDVNDLAVDAAGNVVVIGTFEQNVDFGAGAIKANGSDGFVAKYAPDGTQLWFKHLTGPLTQVTRGVAVDPSGNVLVHGFSDGLTDFGAGPINPANGRGYLLKLDPAGAALWSRFVPAYTADVKTDAAGNIIVGGWFSGSVNLGAGTLVSGGSADAFVAKIDPNGTTLWSKGTGGAGWETLEGLGVDGAGNIAVGGRFESPINWGTATLTPTSSQGDVYVARFDAAGNALWAKGYGDAQSQHLYDLDVDAAGNIAFAADVYGSIDVGTGLFTSVGAEDIVVAKLSPSGSALWAERFGSPTGENNLSIATRDGRIALSAVSWSSPIDLGAGLLPQGTFVASFQP
jgi:hypothetical protein